MTAGRVAPAPLGHKTERLMFFSKKRLGLMLSLACLFISVIQYIPYHIFLLGGSVAAEISYLLISGAVELLLPVIFSVVLLFLSCERKTGRLLLSCLTLSLPRIGFYAPYFYMELYELGFELVDAILLSLLIAVAFSLLFGSFVLLLYAAMRYSYRKIADGYKKKVAPSLLAMLSGGGAFDFSQPRAKIIAPSAIISFIASLPMLKTVEFFINYGGSFVFAEILSIVLEVIYLLLLFVASHFIAVSFAGALARGGER